MDKDSSNCKGFVMPELDDGTYDVIVVDAEERPGGAVAIELAVSSGSHRGELVSLVARGLGRSCTDLLAAPATLTVTDGRPRLRLEA